MLSGYLQQRPWLVQLDRGARVVLQEVDRLADVGVGLQPRLRTLTDGQRGQLSPPLADPCGRADQGAGTLDRAEPRPRSDRAGGDRDRGIDILALGHSGARDHPLRRARIV